MGGTKGQEEDFERYPYIKTLYLKAFDEMLHYMWSRGIKTRWKDKWEVFDWWVYSLDTKQKDITGGQRELEIMDGDT
jgi:hypothetical protein